MYFCAYVVVLHRQLYSLLVLGNIEEGFVDGNGFDKVGVFLKDAVNLF